MVERMHHGIRLLGVGQLRDHRTGGDLVGMRHHHRHRHACARRQAGHVNPPWIDGNWAPPAYLPFEIYIAARLASIASISARDCSRNSRIWAISRLSMPSFAKAGKDCTGGSFLISSVPIIA